MYDFILIRWKLGKIDENGVNRAVTKGYITRSEADEILLAPRVVE